MTIYNLTATQERDNSGIVVGKGESGTPKCLVATVELAAAASSSTISFGKIPARARILGHSRLYWDDLATSGSPVIDMGLFAVDSNVTSDSEALYEALDVSAVSTANLGHQIISDIANFGKKAYLLVSGQTTDPGGQLEVKGTIRDAATTQTGTVTLELYYTLD